MTRQEWLDAANAREWTVQGIKGRGKVSGARLEFPRVHVQSNRAVDFEISWALVERLASGLTKEVRT